MRELYGFCCCCWLDDLSCGKEEEERFVVRGIEELESVDS